MSYIPEIYQGPPTAGSQNTAGASAKTDELGRQDFLTLLVAQLQNQDPLNPADPTEFTAQLAQFSQLEQLFNLNETIAELSQAQATSERMNTLSLMGKEILVEGSRFQLTGEDGVDLQYRVEGEAEEITFVIRDQGGRTVAILRPEETGPGTHTYHWPARTEEGEPLPEGEYQIVISARAAGEEESVAVHTLVRTLVTGVDLEADGAVLVTPIGEFRVDQVHGVYEPVLVEEEAEEEAGAEDGEESGETAAAEEEAAGGGTAVADDAGAMEAAAALQMLYR